MKLGRMPYPSDSQTRNIRANVLGSGVPEILNGNGTKMMLPQQTRDLALQLLAHEGVAGNTSEPTEFAAFGVCERLRQPLITLGKLCTGF